MLIGRFSSVEDAFRAERRNLFGWDALSTSANLPGSSRSPLRGCQALSDVPEAGAAAPALTKCLATQDWRVRAGSEADGHLHACTRSRKNAVPGGPLPVKFLCSGVMYTPLGNISRHSLIHQVRLRTTPCWIANQRACGGGRHLVLVAPGAPGPGRGPRLRGALLQEVLEHLPEDLQRAVPRFLRPVENLEKHGGRVSVSNTPLNPLKMPTNTLV